MVLEAEKLPTPRFEIIVSHHKPPNCTLFPGESGRSPEQPWHTGVDEPFLTFLNCLFNLVVCWVADLLSVCAGGTLVRRHIDLVQILNYIVNGVDGAISYFLRVPDFFPLRRTSPRIACFTFIESLEQQPGTISVGSEVRRRVARTVIGKYCVRTVG